MSTLNEGIPPQGPILIGGQWAQPFFQSPTIDSRPGADRSSGSPVLFIREEIACKLPLWTRIQAAIEGGDAIKALGSTILPRPNPEDMSPANFRRYANYLQRAVWFNVSGRTLQGLTGYVFQKQPTVDLPKDLEPLKQNIDGKGVTLHEQAKLALRKLLAYGGCGLLVDYPMTTGPATKADILKGRISPTIGMYDIWQIRNWDTELVGSATILNLLVLQETYTEVGTDGFSQTTQFQYRVLRRKEGRVSGEIWRKKGTDGQYEVTQSYEPKDKHGKPLEEIPFVILGAEQNNWQVDQPPLADLVDLNIAHFCNSADYEESSFITGQPTPYFTGLTNDWVDHHFKTGVQLGSRAIIPLPTNATAGMLQAEGNSMPLEAMKLKEDQMRAIGARLVQPKVVAKTATEVMVDNSAEVSTLTAATMNLFIGYQKALELCGLFVGEPTSKILYELNEPLNRDTITPQMAQAALEMWMEKLLDYTEARGILKRAGLAFMDDKEVFDGKNKMQFDGGADVLINRAQLADQAALNPTGAPTPPVPGRKKKLTMPEPQPAPNPQNS